MRKKLKGYSLLEMTIVIGLIFMISAFIAPFLIINIQNSNIEAEAKLMVSAIRVIQIKNKSGELGKSYGVKLSSSKYTAYTGINFATFESSYDVDLKTGNQIKQITFTNAVLEIAFIKNSIRPINSGYFILYNSSNSFKVEINSEGLIFYTKQ